MEQGLLALEPGKTIVTRLNNGMKILMEQMKSPEVSEWMHLQKERIEARTAEAQSLVCTADTVSSVKATRAELKKEFDEWEEARKTIKRAFQAPNDLFESLYRECVGGPYSRADADLKQKADAVESEIKRQCEEKLRAYFAELCAAERVEFLRYEQAKIKVDLTSAKQKTPNKLREQIAIFVTGVAEDVGRISKMDDAEEILVEYKRSLNLGDAVAVVQDRRRRVEEERAAKAARAEALVREAEAVRKVEALLPPVKVENRIPRVSMTLFDITLSEAKEIQNFLKERNIRYE